MRWHGAAFGAMVALLAAKAALAADPTDCDRLAGSPVDPNRLGAGIGLHGIEPAEAIAACEKALAADPNNPRLLFNLARAHQARWLGEQPTEDERALVSRSVKAAADQNYPAALIAEAAYYWQGQAGFPQDPAEAMRLLDKAAMSDAAEARKIRRLYLLQPVVDEKPVEAQVRFVKAAADTGDPDALFALGMSEDDNQRQEEAARLWRRAAERGSVEAALLLATDYLAGEGGDRGLAAGAGYRHHRRGLAAEEPRGAERQRLAGIVDGKHRSGDAPGIAAFACHDRSRATPGGVGRVDAAIGLGAGQREEHETRLHLTGIGRNPGDLRVGESLDRQDTG